MKRVVHTGLPEFGRPTEHAVMADGHLRATAVPLKMDGTFEIGRCPEPDRAGARESREDGQGGGG